MEIKWKIDHDCSYGFYYLKGDYINNRLVRKVFDGLWGIPLMYAKYCITRQFKILDKK